MLPNDIVSSNPFERGDEYILVPRLRMCRAPVRRPLFDEAAYQDRIVHGDDEDAYDWAVRVQHEMKLDGRWDYD